MRLQVGRAIVSPISAAAVLVVLAQSPHYSFALLMRTAYVLAACSSSVRDCRLRIATHALGCAGSPGAHLPARRMPERNLRAARQLRVRSCDLAAMNAGARTSPFAAQPARRFSALSYIEPRTAARVRPTSMRVTQH